MSFYFQVVETNTRELFGHLTDVSMIGFCLDCMQTVPLNQKFFLSIETTAEVSDTEFIDLLVESVWSRKDNITPNVYNVGFTILNINPHDAEVLKRIVEHYGSS